MKRLLLLIVPLCWSCSQKPLDAQSIVDKSIEVYGGSKLYKSDIEFDFRDIHYRSYNNNGMISYERFIADDSLGSIHDVLNNDGFTRTIEGEVVTLDEEWTGKYSRSVNAVVYFFRIPFNLNDAAVNKRLLGESMVGDKAYYKVEVTFDEEGGGDDFDDAFVYWFNKETFIIDYFAYSYSTDGGGKRFRQMINPRTINDRLVVDYINFEPKDPSQEIESFDQAFLAGELEELSRIEKRNVKISYLDE